MANIYELTGELLALMDMADEEDLDPQALADTLEGLEGEFDEKVDGWCKAVKNLEAEQKALKKESKRLAERAKKTENNIKHMKETLMFCMKAIGKTEAGGLFKAKIQRNGSVLPLVFQEGFTAEEAPELFQKVAYSFDNDAIREALDGGAELPFVHYGERGESVRIK